MAVANEIGNLLAVGLGPLFAGIFCKIADSWWPIVAMIVFYSAIGLLSAIIMPEVADRDLEDPKDAAEK